MTSQKDTSPKRDLSAKKAAVLGSPAPNSSRRNQKVVLLACVLIVSLVGLFLFTYSEPKGKIAHGPADAAAVSPVNGELLHPLAFFADGQAKHFVLETADGVGIRYFILQTGDGIVRTAFDTCDVCWRAKMGYVQEGDMMICRNCDMRFPTSTIGEVRGGCNPAHLKNEVRQENVVIFLEDILEGRHYFDFSSSRGQG